MCTANKCKLEVCTSSLGSKYHCCRDHIPVLGGKKTYTEPLAPQNRVPQKSEIADEVDGADDALCRVMKLLQRAK